jgi:glycosyltransferase involved in cell wall biosynthesis
VGAAVLVNLCQAAPVAWGRQVVVLHDASPLRHPEYFTRSYAVAAGALLRALARSRALVVTVSPFARAELRDVLGIPEERLTVLRPGAPELRPDALLRGEDLAGGPYALFVGGHDPRKNLELLTAIWPEVWLRHGLRLVVVGRPGTTVHRAEDPQPAEWLTRIGGPSDSTLGALHRDAVCLLAPSHYEGFGLPLLEASTQGTPFLATPTGAAPELAVRGWQIVPPDRGAWLAGIDRVLSLGDEEWRGVRHDARERAASYRWDSSARQLVGLVEQAAA